MSVYLESSVVSFLSQEEKKCRSYCSSLSIPLRQFCLHLRCNVICAVTVVSGGDTAHSSFEWDRTDRLLQSCEREESDISPVFLPLKFPPFVNQKFLTVIGPVKTVYCYSSEYAGVGPYVRF